MVQKLFAHPVVGLIDQKRSGSTLVCNLVSPADLTDSPTKLPKASPKGKGKSPVGGDASGTSSTRVGVKTTVGVVQLRIQWGDGQPLLSGCHLSPSSVCLLFVSFSLLLPLSALEVS